MLSNSGTIPYRRLTDPLMLAVATTSQRTQVPPGFIPAEATSFRITNPNPFWVRLKGFTGPAASSGTISATEGWLFQPGFSGVFTTQFPEYMATISVGAAAGTGVLEISYGIGGGGESSFFAAANNGGTASTVSVSNFPANQTVSGAVAVSNFPAIQQVADNGASLTVDTPQLPATLGTKTAANSLPVTPASDATFTTVDRGSASINTGQVTLTQGTAVQVVPARAGRRKVTLSPTSNIPYLIGNTGVTTTTGFAVLSGGAVTLDTTAAIFVIASNNGTMTFVETF